MSNINLVCPASGFEQTHLRYCCVHDSIRGNVLSLAWFCILSGVFLAIYA